MVHIIAIFNHKGGVAKTSTCFSLAWKLAASGKRVIMVDADSQCNLTGLTMGILPPEVETGSNSDEDRAPQKTDEQKAKETDAEFGKIQLRASELWGRIGDQNIHSALKPVFFSEPKQLEPVKCMDVPGNDNLFLLPGSLNLADYESDLALAHTLKGAFGSQRNLPGAISALLHLTAESMNADYMIVDLSPSLGAINQNIVCISDEVIIPCAPDYFSVMALQSLAEILPKWIEFANEAASTKTLKDATYPFPQPRLRFGGVIISRYVVYKKKPAKAFETWINNVSRECLTSLVPALTSANMMHSQGTYKKAEIDSDFVLAKVRDLNSLRPKSQSLGIPPYELTEQQIGLKGESLTNSMNQVREADQVFSDLARKVEALCH